MYKNNLHYLSATEVIAHYKTGELSPVEMINAVIERADQISESVNPFADKYYDEAYRRAELAQARYAKGNAGSLEGVPLLVKDDVSIKGKRATVGSLMYADTIHQHTDPTVNKLIRAGANVFARSTCPEFCWLFACHSRMWGVTRNPWRLDITPGGSSGGSAAALAAGATTLATGSDCTGSIRQPAAQCGVVSFKPPFGRNALDADSSFNPYVSIGPMTRSIKDAALMQNIMSGPDPLDHNCLPNKINIPLSLGDVRGMRIAYSMDFGHYEVIDDVRRETLATLNALAAEGAIVSEIEIDWASRAIQSATMSQEFIFAGSLKYAIENYSDMLSDYVMELYETASAVTAQDYRDSLDVAGEVWFKYLGPLLNTYDALITPAVSCPEIPADNWQKDTVLVNGKEQTDTDTAMTVLFNMFNRCPVLSVPAGMTDTELPVGIQIVGRPYDDVTTFKIGYAIENFRPWSQRLPKFPYKVS